MGFTSVERPKRTRKKGSGRPAMPEECKKKMMTMRLPIWLTEWLREQEDSQSEVIERALVNYYNLRRLKVKKNKAMKEYIKSIDNNKKEA